MDRIDIHVEVPVVAFTDLAKEAAEEPSAAIGQRVISARKTRESRLSKSRIRLYNRPVTCYLWQ
jgi:magnesium chelatase family protein